MNGLVTILTDHEKVLVHGDVSPKNIIFRKEFPVFLDAECATAGDPAFDLAFCLNHRILKAIPVRPLRQTLLASVNTFWSAYRKQVLWEHVDTLKQRVCRLLPALMLVRGRFGSFRRNRGRVDIPSFGWARGGQLKVGSFTRTERMVKWNECLRIQEELGAGTFVGGAPLADTWWGKQHLDA